MFFVKKRKLNSNSKIGSTKKQKKNKTEKKQSESLKQQEEITSSSEDELNDNNVNAVESETESESETAQEKQLRLAKVYLEEIQKEEQRRAEDKNIDDDLIAQRLQKDYLQHAGKLQQKVASTYTGTDESLTILKCKHQSRSITCLCISLNGQYVFSGSKDGSVVKWSLKNKKVVATIPFVKDNKCRPVKGHYRNIKSIALSFDGSFLAVTDESCDIQIWNPVDLSHVHTFSGHRDIVTDLAFQKNALTLYSCSKDKSVKVWSLSEMMYVETLYGHQDSVAAIDAAGLKERAITAGGKDGTVRLWKISEESQLIFNCPSGTVDCVKFINEDCYVSGGDAGEISVWSVLKKKPLCSVKEAHGSNPINKEPHWITALATLRNTDLIASGSQDGQIRLWKLGDNFKTIEKLLEIPICGFINCIEFSKDGDYLIAAIGQEHRLGRWSIVKSARNSVAVVKLITSKHKS